MTAENPKQDIHEYLAELEDIPGTRVFTAQRARKGYQCEPGLGHLRSVGLASPIGEGNPDDLVRRPPALANPD